LIPVHNWPSRQGLWTCLQRKFGPNSACNGPLPNTNAKGDARKLACLFTQEGMAGQFFCQDTNSIVVRERSNELNELIILQACNLSWRLAA